MGTPSNLYADIQQAVRHYKTEINPHDQRSRARIRADIRSSNYNCNNSSCEFNSSSAEYNLEQCVCMDPEVFCECNKKN